MPTTCQVGLVNFTKVVKIHRGALFFDSPNKPSCPDQTFPVYPHVGDEFPQVLDHAVTETTIPTSLHPPPPRHTMICSEFLPPSPSRSPPIAKQWSVQDEPLLSEDRAGASPHVPVCLLLRYPRSEQIPDPVCVSLIDRNIPCYMV